MPIPHGSSKDHRPDLTPAVVALRVSHDGGIPCVSQSWAGNPSDPQVLQPRAEALRRAFQDTPSPRYLVAAAQLSGADPATALAPRGFLPRIPATRTRVAQVMSPALQWDPGPPVDPTTRSPPLMRCHEGMAQRWLVVDAPAALDRAEAALKQATQRAHQALTPPLVPRQAPRLGAPAAAHEARTALAKRWKYHRVASSHLTAHQRYRGTGRPTPRRPRKASAWPIQAHAYAEDEARERDQHAKACAGLGTHSDAREGSATEVLGASKGQAHVEGGLRLLKAPLFFVSSLCGNKPTRLAGFLMGMPLALLVYSVAQRRLRKQ